MGNKKRRKDVDKEKETGSQANPLNWFKRYPSYHSLNYQEQLQPSDQPLTKRTLKHASRIDQIRMQELEAVEGSLQISMEHDENQVYSNPFQQWHTMWCGQFNGLIHPESPFRTRWDVLMLLLIFVTCFYAPFTWAFSPPSSNKAALSWSRLVTEILDLIVDVLYILDILINSRTGYKVMGGVVMDRQLIWQHYSRDCLVFDVIAVTPIITDFLRFIVRISYVRRYVKLLQLFKLRSSFERIAIIEESIANISNTLYTAILFLLCALLVVCNWLSCLWFFVQTVQEGGLLNSWLHEQEDLRESVEEWVGVEASSQDSTYKNQIKFYVACFYWASSAGDGFDAQTTAERLCAIIGQFTVVNGMGAFIIASLMAALETFNLSSQKHSMYRQKIDAVNAFMRIHKLPKALESDVRRYYKEVWTREQLDFTEFKMLDEFPQDLRRPIMQHITRKLIGTFKFFHEYVSGPDGIINTEEERTWADEIASRLKPQYATPNEYIIREGERGTDMYLIKQGKVEVEVGKRVVGYQSSGSYFGDIALIGTAPGCDKRTASIRALTYCELFVLTKADLHEIWQKFPAMKELMEQVARNKFKRSSNRGTQEGDRSDCGSVEDDHDDQFQDENKMQNS